MYFVLILLHKESFIVNSVKIQCYLTFFNVVERLIFQVWKTLCMCLIFNPDVFVLKLASSIM
jgi:hypothetical protein